MTHRDINSIVAEVYPKVLADIITSYCEFRPHHLKTINLKESTIPRGLCRSVVHKLNTLTRDVVLPFFGNDRHESLTLRVTINPSCQVIPLPDERFAVADGVGIQVYTSEGKFLYRWEVDKSPFFPERAPYRPIYISINTARDTIAVTYRTIYGKYRIIIFDIRGDDIHPRTDWLWDYGINSMIFISPNELAIIDLRCHRIRILSIEGRELRSWQHGLGYPPFPKLSLLHREGKTEIAVMRESVAHLFTPEGKFLREWSFEPTEAPPSIIQLPEGGLMMNDHWQIRGYHRSMDGDFHHSWLHSLGENDMICDIARITEDKIVAVTWSHGECLINILELRSPEGVC